MKKKMGWMFTIVGLIGLLPALYGILVFGLATLGGINRLSDPGGIKQLLLAFSLFVLLVLGIVLWTGNIRYSFGRRAWWGNRSFWKWSAVYNFAGVFFVLSFFLFFREGFILFWAPYPLLAAFCSLYVSRREIDSVAVQAIEIK